MENHQSGVSSRVKELRTERAWSQEQLAGIAWLSARTIQRLENGEKASFETLKAIATAFDLDVRDLGEAEVSSPSNKEPKKSEVIFIPRITSGNELCDMISGAHAHRMQNDELDNDEEVSLVGSFLQDAQDTGDCWDVMEPLHRVEATHRLTRMIRELEEHSLWVFGVRTKRHIQPAIAEMQVFSMLVVTILVLRDTNRTIIKKPPLNEVVAAVING